MMFCNAEFVSRLQEIRGTAVFRPLLRGRTHRFRDLIFLSFTLEKQHNQEKTSLENRKTKNKFKVSWCKPDIRVVKVPYCLRLVVAFVRTPQEKTRFTRPTTKGRIRRPLLFLRKT